MQSFDQNDCIDHASSKVFVIKCQMRKDLTQRTQMDHEEIKYRRRKCGINYDNTIQILNKLFFGATKHKQLLDLAQIIAAKHKIKIDRLSIRSFECIICWYCQHWKTIKPDVVKFAGELFEAKMSSMSDKFDDEKIKSFSQNLQQLNSDLQKNEFYEQMSLEQTSPSFNLQVQDTNSRILPMPEIANVSSSRIISQQQVEPSNNNKAKLPSIFEFANSCSMSINLGIMPEYSQASYIHLDNSAPVIRHDFSNNNLFDNFYNLNGVNNNNRNQLAYIPLSFKNLYLNQKKRKNVQTQYGSLFPLLKDREINQIQC